MAPLVAIFPAHELPFHSQINAEGKKRKGFDGDLKKCELFEIVQYMCGLEEPERKDSRVICREMPRLFRRCRDRQGIFTVETTAWEGESRKS